MKLSNRFLLRQNEFFAYFLNTSNPSAEPDAEKDQFARRDSGGKSRARDAGARLVFLEVQ